MQAGVLPLNVDHTWLKWTEHNEKTYRYFSTLNIELIKIEFLVPNAIVILVIG